MTNLERKIDTLISGLERIIAIPPIPAIPAIPPIPPILPIPPIPAIPAIIATGDHDLLIKLETKVDGLIMSVENLSARDSQYVLKEDFVFWRNLLVGSMLATIGATMKLILKI